MTSHASRSNHGTARLDLQPDGIPRPLGEVLLRSGRLTEEQLASALQSQTQQGDHRLLGEILVERGLVTKVDVAAAVAESQGVPFVRDPARIADATVVEILPRDFVRQHQVLPLFLVREVMTIAELAA